MTGRDERAKYSTEYSTVHDNTKLTLTLSLNCELVLTRLEPTRAFAGTKLQRNCTFLEVDRRRRRRRRRRQSTLSLVLVLRYC
jgi:hypothetical protein